jgi:hypothetical protein
MVDSSRQTGGGTTRARPSTAAAGLQSAYGGARTTRRPASAVPVRKAAGAATADATAAGGSKPSSPRQRVQVRARRLPTLHFEPSPSPRPGSSLCNLLHPSDSSCNSLPAVCPSAGQAGRYGQAAVGGRHGGEAEAARCAQRAARSGRRWCGVRQRRAAAGGSPGGRDGHH